jgi:hypothetical protein
MDGDRDRRVVRRGDTSLRLFSVLSAGLPFAIQHAELELFKHSVACQPGALCRIGGDTAYYVDVPLKLVAIACVIAACVFLFTASRRQPQLSS